MMKKAGILLCLLIAAGTASAMSSGQYTIGWNVTGGGGGISGSSLYRITGTVGEPSGSMTNTQYRIVGGFWSMDYPSPVPVISGISPEWKQAGSSAFNLTVTGNNFTSSSTVNFSGTNKTVLWQNSTTIIARIPATDVARVGNRTVTVSNPAPGGGNSNTMILAVKSIPVLTSISPKTADKGGPGFTLTVTGNHFTKKSRVQWEGANLTTTFVSATRLNAAVPKSKIETKGKKSVKVLNPGPFGGLSEGKKFTVT
jgi:hypothetical protein